MGKDDLWAKKHLQKRVDDNTCAACRKKFMSGHRVQQVYIIINPDAINPQKVTERGLELGMDSEFVHARCDDPFLNGRRVE